MQDDPCSRCRYHLETIPALTEAIMDLVKSERLPPHTWAALIPRMCEVTGCPYAAQIYEMA